MVVERLTPNERLALDNYVHGPDRTSSGYVKFAGENLASAGITYGCVLDNHIVPLRPGRTMALVGRPGMGKTSFGGALLKIEAARLMRENVQNRYVAHVTWEMPPEEVESMYHDAHGEYGVTDVAWGRVPIDKIIANSLSRPAIPIWIFGESIYHTGFDTPPMTIERVYDGIRAIWKEWRMLPSVMFFDYLQDIPVPDEKDRHTQVTAAMRLISRLAVQAKCPALVGVQANARVDDYAVPIPTMKDTEWSAVIEQKCYTILALWRPIKSLPLHVDANKFVEVGGVTYPNSDELLVIKLLKQRFDKGYGIWGVKFDPNMMTLSDYELTSVDLDL